MRINTAVSTKVVLRHSLTELVSHQFSFASDHLQVTFRDCRDNSTFAFAERTIAAMGIRQAIGQMDFQNDRTAMATGSMVHLDMCISDLLEHRNRLNLVVEPYPFRQ